jgi:hypothetical protein
VHAGLQYINGLVNMQVLLIFYRIYGDRHGKTLHEH